MTSKTPILQILPNSVSRGQAYTCAGARALRYLNPEMEYTLRSVQDLYSDVKHWIQDDATLQLVLNCWEDLRRHMEPELSVVAGLAFAYRFGGWWCDLDFEPATKFATLQLSNDKCYLAEDRSSASEWPGLKLLYSPVAGHSHALALLKSASELLWNKFLSDSKPAGPDWSHRAAQFGLEVVANATVERMQLGKLPGFSGSPCYLREQQDASSADLGSLGCVRSDKDAGWKETALRYLYNMDYNLRLPFHVHESNVVRDDVPVVLIVLLVVILLFVIGIPIAIHFSRSAQPPAKKDDSAKDTTSGPHIVYVPPQYYNHGQII